MRLQLLRNGFHGLACLHVVQARDDEVDGRLAVKRPRGDRLLELGQVLGRGDVHVVHLEDCVWVELRAVMPIPVHK